MLTTESAQQALHMFAFLAVELTLLFLLISYGIGVVQSYLPPGKIQQILGAKQGKGYFIAAALGAITPFCSCSTIPFLKGLLKVRAGFGTMMVFLFASPLLNPIIIGLFVVTFGVKVALFYFVVAMGVSLLAGWLLEKFGYEKEIRAEALQETESTGGCGCNSAPKVNRWKKIWDST